MLHILLLQTPNTVLINHKPKAKPPGPPKKHKAKKIRCYPQEIEKKYVQRGRENFFKEMPSNRN